MRGIVQKVHFGLIPALKMPLKNGQEDKKAEKGEFFQNSDDLSFQLSLHIENLKEIVCIYLLIVFIKNIEVINAKWQR